MTNMIQHEHVSRFGKITEYLHRDDAPRWTLWLTSPRCEVAYVAYGRGFTQLAALLHRDLASDPEEEFQAGYRTGLRKGLRAAAAVTR